MTERLRRVETKKIRRRRYPWDVIDNMANTLGPKVKVVYFAEQVLPREHFNEVKNYVLL
jgi:hypothetical protein